MYSQDITLDICLYYVMNKPLFMSRAIFKPHGLLQAKVALYKGYCVIDQQMICCNIK